MKGEIMAKIKMAVICVAIIAVCAQTALAHHLWVSKNDDLYAVCRGLMPERLDAYDASNLLHFLISR
jgi:hypothetical protein